MLHYTYKTIILRTIGILQSVRVLVFISKYEWINTNLPSPNISPVPKQTTKISLSPVRFPPPVPTSMLSLFSGGVEGVGFADELGLSPLLFIDCCGGDMKAFLELLMSGGRFAIFSVPMVVFSLVVEKTGPGPGNTLEPWLLVNGRGMSLN